MARNVPVAQIGTDSYYNYSGDAILMKQYPEETCIRLREIVGGSPNRLFVCLEA